MASLVAGIHSVLTSYSVVVQYLTWTVVILKILNMIWQCCRIFIFASVVDVVVENLIYFVIAPYVCILVIYRWMLLKLLE